MSCYDQPVARFCINEGQFVLLCRFHVRFLLVVASLVAGTSATESLEKTRLGSDLLFVESSQRARSHPYSETPGFIFAYFPLCMSELAATMLL